MQSNSLHREEHRTAVLMRPKSPMMRMLCCFEKKVQKTKGIQKSTMIWCQTMLLVLLALRGPSSVHTRSTGDHPASGRSYSGKMTSKKGQTRVVVCFFWFFLVFFDIFGRLIRGHLRPSGGCGPCSPTPCIVRNIAQLSSCGQRAP